MQDGLESDNVLEVNRVTYDKFLEGGDMALVINLTRPGDNNINTVAVDGGSAVACGRKDSKGLDMSTDGEIMKLKFNNSKAANGDGLPEDEGAGQAGGFDQLTESPIMKRGHQEDENEEAFNKSPKNQKIG